MKAPAARALEIVEVVAVTGAAAFYMVHWWPVPVVDIAVALGCVVVSSLPLCVKRYRDRRRYGPMQRCFGFGLLLVAASLKGRSGLPFAVGFGILFVASAYSVIRDFSRGRT